MESYRRKLLDKIGLAWHDHAACKNEPTELFFNGKPSDKRWKTAMMICDGCPVRRTCLEWALQWPAHELHGIWGGTSQRERLRLTQKAPTQ